MHARNLKMLAVAAVIAAGSLLPGAPAQAYWRHDHGGISLGFNFAPDYYYAPYYYPAPAYYYEEPAYYYDPPPPPPRVYYAPRPTYYAPPPAYYYPPFYNVGLFGLSINIPIR